MDLKNSYLSCINISKYYDINVRKEYANTKIISSDRIEGTRYVALRNVSFELNKGDRLGLLGLNGAGKTTLLKIIAGLIKPSEGQIYMQGKTSSLIESGNLLYRDLTGIENIFLVGSLLGIPRREIERVLPSVIEFSEIGPFLEEPVKHYSAGMMLRLTMAIYKELKPDVLLLDEVLSVGDISFRQKFNESFSEFIRDIPIVIMISHEFADIVSQCNKCLVLKDGEVEFLGSVSEALELYNVEHLNRTAKQEFRDKLSVRNVSHQGAVLQYRISEPVRLTFDLDVRVPLNDFKVIVYLSTKMGPLLYDSELFVKEYTRRDLLPGIYHIAVEVPGYLLNKGMFFAHFIMEEGEEFLGEIAGSKFEIIPDAWEVGKPWNIAPKYPLRPRLNWEITTRSGS